MRIFFQSPERNLRLMMLASGLGICATMALVPACVLRVYGRRQHSTIGEDEQALASVPS